MIRQPSRTQVQIPQIVQKLASKFPFPNVASPSTKSLRLDKFKELRSFYEKKYAFVDRYNEPYPSSEHLREGSKRLISHTRNGEIQYRAFDPKGTRLERWLDKRQLNTDIPDKLHNYDQGHAQRRNDHLDYRAMDDRDFRERCKVYGNALYALQEKKLVDFELPSYLDHHKVAAHLKCEEDVAVKIVTAFKELKLDRATCVELLENKVHACHEKRKSDCAIAQTFRWSEPHELADYLESLSMTIAEPDWSMIDHPEEHGGTPMHGWEYMIDEVIDEIRNEHIVIDDETNQPMVADELDNDRISNCFRAHRLYHGNEALSHEFLTAIRCASTQTLLKIQAGFFESKNPYTGKTYPPKYGYLTISQKAQAWVYIKARKKELEKINAKTLSDKGKEVRHWIHQLRDWRMASALIYSAQAGTTFSYPGTKIIFDKPISPADASALWAIANKYKK